VLLVRQVLWLFPIYSISFILNLLWYQDIADHAFVIHGVKVVKAEFSWSRWLNSIATAVYQQLLMLTFFMQRALISWVPLVGSWLAGLHMCWLFAFYAFDYKWTLQNVELEARLSNFESHWAYYTGFGALVCPP